MDINILQDTFVKNLEIERTRLRLSQKEMAQALGLPLSTYKRIIYREVELRGVILIMRLYFLTGKFCNEFLEIRDEHIDVMRKVHGLSADELHAVDTVIEYIKKRRI